MTLVRARIVVLLSALVSLVVIVAGLTVFGGPQDARRGARDLERLADLTAIAAALSCHVRTQAPPAAPTTLAGIAPACLAPGPAAELVDPQTGAPYRIEQVPDGSARVCAAFELPDRPPYRTPPNFDAISGCLIAAPEHERN